MNVNNSIFKSGQYARIKSPGMPHTGKVGKITSVWIGDGRNGINGIWHYRLRFCFRYGNDEMATYQERMMIPASKSEWENEGIGKI